MFSYFEELEQRGWNRGFGCGIFVGLVTLPIIGLCVTGIMFLGGWL